MILFCSSRSHHLTRFNVFNLLNDYKKNMMYLINVHIKKQTLAVSPLTMLPHFFSLLITLHIQCLSICIPNENYNNFFYAFMQVYIIEYLLGASQVNVHRASKKKLCIVRTSILEKTLPHIDNFRRTLLCDS